MQEKLSYNPYWIGVENTATSGYTWSTGIVVSFIATSLTNMIALLDWIRNQHI